MNTIKNNDPTTTFYTLSITELLEMCEDYHEIVDDEDFKSPSSFIELEVDYLMKSRNKLNK